MWSPGGYYSLAVTLSNPPEPYIMLVLFQIWEEVLITDVPFLSSLFYSCNYWKLRRLTVHEIDLSSVWLTSNLADLVGDGVSQDPFLLHVHHEHPLHAYLQRLQGGGVVVVSTVTVGDVLFQLEGVGLWPSLSRNHGKLPHRAWGGNCMKRERHLRWKRHQVF